MNSRTLIYTCCDKKYSHFIPLFCAALLWSNTDIDIEIGVSCDSLDPKEDSAIKELQKLYPKSKILIKYNFFTINPNTIEGPYMKAVYDGKKMMINTVRFVSNPTIKDDYTYISDIDIISLRKNFYEYHIKQMNDYDMIYSNVIRKEMPQHMSGLHFVKTDKWYPVNLEKCPRIRYSANDEIILKQIAESKTKLNYDLNDINTQRPIHGPHISLNRKEPGGYIDKFDRRIPGWCASPWKHEYKEFIKSEVYKTVEKSFDPLIKMLLSKLNNYYGIV